MRFRHLIKRNRFLDALALCDPVDPVTDPDRRFALYRRGLSTGSAAEGRGR